MGAQGSRRARRLATWVSAALIAASAPVLGAAPAAAATASEGMTVLSVTDRPAYSGTRYVVGELRNDGSTHVDLVTVDLTVHDSGGRLLSTESAYVLVGELAPGERSPFAAYVDEPPGYASYRISKVGARARTTPPNHNFDVVVTNEYTGAYGDRHVVGTVRNRNTTTSQYVNVVMTSYDSARRAVDADTAYAETGSTYDLAPGAEAPFHFTSYDDVAPASYALLAQSFTAATLPPDRDADGVSDAQDNCVAQANPAQANLDGDPAGDVCDDIVDVRSDSGFYPYVRALVRAQVTSGCGGTSTNLRYCPGASVSRGDMAVFLTKAHLGQAGTDALPAYAGGFSDVAAGDYYSKHVRYLVDQQVTAGCGGGRYCPAGSVIRGDMSVFLARTSLGREGADGLPAYAGEFSDVSGTEGYAKYVRWAKDSGVTAGCGNGRFCPATQVTREQMAVFLVKAFDLPL